MYLWVSYIGNLQFIGDKYHKEIECVSDPAPARSRSGKEPGQTTNRLRVEFFEFVNSVYFIEKLELLSEKAKHFYDDYLEAGNVNFLWQGFTNCIKSLGILNFLDIIEHEQ